MEGRDDRTGESPSAGGAGGLYGERRCERERESERSSEGFCGEVNCGFGLGRFAFR
jgi:hypothetical protein